MMLPHLQVRISNYLHGLFVVILFSQFVFTAPSNPSQDVYAALSAGCDAVVFLVFNKFDSDCKTQTYGHEFGGVSDGGMCEQNQGKGYTIVVDQVI